MKNNSNKLYDITWNFAPNDWDELQRPYSWRKPRLVFVNGMSDLFHKDVPERFIVEAFNAMHDNPMHTFQVLTKRPERAAEWARQIWGEFPDNVWIGTSVENQGTADQRIPELLKIPAQVRFLSCEPLLGPIDLNRVKSGNYQFFVRQSCLKDWLIPVDMGIFDNFGYIDWVIVGGESGRNARPMHPDWARSLRDQCQAAGVPFFFKQWGKTLPFEQEESYNSGWMNKEYPVNDIGYIVGKKAAGRLLDGREWNEWPEGITT